MAETATSIVDIIPQTKIGRPRKLTSVKQINTAIDTYFRYCDKQKKHLTLPGLALALGVTRRTLLTYEGLKDEFENSFLPPIKRAKAIVEEYKSQLLLDKDRPAGVIFDLKNNHGWRDDNEIRQPDNKAMLFQVIVNSDDNKVEVNTPKAIDITPDKQQSTPLPDKADNDSE